MKRFIDGDGKTLKPGLYYRKSEIDDKEPRLCLFKSINRDGDVQFYEHGFGTGIWHAYPSDCKDFFRVNPRELEMLTWRLGDFKRQYSWLERGIAIHQMPKVRPYKSEVHKRLRDKKLQLKKTKTYYLLNPSRLPIEARGGESVSRFPELQETLDDLMKRRVILGYSTIEGANLGFPLEQPKNTLIYRVDYVINDIDRVIKEYRQKKPIRTKRRGWARAKIRSKEELRTAKMMREIFYDKASVFFDTKDISRWTAEMNTLDDVDPNFKEKDKRGCKNKLSKEAFLSLIYGAGYIMARVIVFDGKLSQFEKELGDGYIKRTINI